MQPQQQSGGSAARRPGLNLTFLGFRIGSMYFMQGWPLHRFLKVMDRDLLRHAYAVKFVVSDQRIGDITEGSLDRFFVGDQLLPLLRFGESKITAQLTTLKDRLDDVCPVTPGGEIGTQYP